MAWTAELRRESVAAIAALPFDGIAIGGLSVGESKAEMASTLEVVADALGDDPRPRYLMGVGSPVDFFSAVERGIDLFDCVLPTRVARTGQVWTDAGRLNLRNAAFLDDPAPIDSACACEACRGFSRAYVAHLFRARELLAYRLATVHNVTWTLELMRRLRASLADGSFSGLRDRVEVRSLGRYRSVDRSSIWHAKADSGAVSPIDRAPSSMSGAPACDSRSPAADESAKCSANLASGGKWPIDRRRRRMADVTV